MVTNVQDFSLTCRFCIRCETENTTLQLQSLYNTPSEDSVKFIAEIFIETTPWLIISPDDELPQAICKACLDKLMEVQRFQQMCTESEQTLLSLIQNSNQQPIKIELTEIDAIDNDEIYSSKDDSYESDDYETKFDPIGATTSSAAAAFKTLRQRKPIKKKIKKYNPVATKLKTTKHECELCGKIFSENYKLNAHRVVHTKEKPYKCDVCGCSYAFKDSLKRHLKKHGVNATETKVPKQKKAVKPKAQKIKKTKTLLEQKTTNKADVLKKFKCDQCDKVFSDKTKVMAHRVVHTKEKPYKCEYCECSYSFIDNLKRHLKKSQCFKTMQKHEKQD